MVLIVEDGQGLPIWDVEVSIKESWESWRTWDSIGSADGDQAFYRARWESDFVPWLRGRTDVRGRVDLSYDVTRLDGSKGKAPPREFDWISGREYLVRLRFENAEEEVRMRMKAGNRSRGARFAVRVEAIHPPDYVPAKK